MVVQRIVGVAGPGVMTWGSLRGPELRDAPGDARRAQLRGVSRAFGTWCPVTPGRRRSEHGAVRRAGNGDRRGRRRLAIALGAAIAAATLASLVFEVALSSVPVAGYVDRFALYRLVAALGFAGLGAVCAASQPENRLGWIWLGFGAVFGGSLLAEGWGLAGVWGQWPMPGASIVLWLAEWAAIAVYWLVPTSVLLLSPDGRLPSRRWRPVAWTAVGAAAVSGLGWLVIEPSASDVSSYPPGYRSPLPTWSGAPVLQGVGAVLGLLALVGSVASVVARYRRADAVERAQLQWLGLGAAGTVALLVGAFAAGSGGGVLIALSTLPLVAGAAVAVVRHGLWDIDVVLNRSLVFGALTVIVVCTYVAVIVVLGGVLGATTGAPLLATALVAVAAMPLRRRLDSWANQVVYGHRDDPAAVLRVLGERLDAVADRDDALPSAVETLVSALRLASACVRVGPTVLARAGDGAAGASAVAAERFELSFRGREVGLLEVVPLPGAPLTARARRTLAEVSRQLAVIVHAHQLTDDLVRSRERLVVAREEERRRLRHDLHDGLGPSLAAMALQADRSRELLRADPDTAGAILEQLAGRIRAAVADVRAVVEDLGVPELETFGLPRALDHLAERFRAGGLDVAFDVEMASGAPLPAAVEVAVFRIAGEALANVARHADAVRCDLSLRVNGDVDLTVRDDGRGFEPGAAGGVGLRSMQQRVDELGGSLAIESSPGAGTSVRVRLPQGAGER